MQYAHVKQNWMDYKNEGEMHMEAHLHENVCIHRQATFNFIH